MHWFSILPCLRPYFPQHHFKDCYLYQDSFFWELLFIESQRNCPIEGIHSLFYRTLLFRINTKIYFDHFAGISKCCESVTFRSTIAIKKKQLNPFFASLNYELLIWLIIVHQGLKFAKTKF